MEESKHLKIFVKDHLFPFYAILYPKFIVNLQ